MLAEQLLFFLPQVLPVHVLSIVPGIPGRTFGKPIFTSTLLLVRISRVLGIIVVFVGIIVGISGVIVVIATLVSVISIALALPLLAVACAVIAVTLFEFIFMIVESFFRAGVGGVAVAVPVVGVVVGS